MNIVFSKIFKILIHKHRL